MIHCIIWAVKIQCLIMFKFSNWLEGCKFRRIFKTIGEVSPNFCQEMFLFCGSSERWKNTNQICDERTKIHLLVCFDLEKKDWWVYYTPLSTRIDWICDLYLNFINLNSIYLLRKYVYREKPSQSSWNKKNQLNIVLIFLVDFMFSKVLVFKYDVFMDFFLSVTLGLCGRLKKVINSKSIKLLKMMNWKFWQEFLTL